MTTNFSAAEVRAAVPMSHAIEAVREAFADLAAGRFSQPDRLVFGTADNAVLVMSAHHTPTGAAVVKTAGVVLDRDPAIVATLVWTDALGQLTADAAAVTTLRTGAATGVATDLLADPEARKLALLGAGEQAADQVRAVAAVREITELTVYNRGAERAKRLVAALREEFPEMRIDVADTAADAVGDADVVCCVTSASDPLFELSDLPERVHVNAIGSFRPTMRELPDDLVKTASVVVVDQLGAAREEAGEIHHALKHGLRAESDIEELGTALTTRPDRVGRTVFKSVGVAAQDWAVARLLARYARTES
ncbi:ornithine cyclodeaminase family protein [Saccharomonospora glauca]|jgi:ornithine cyclodeaminase|uniref:Putative ornithine cyclodeaminase, mu-crystallin n=1 Tax=Saccharomonospora glauca K62 TaxID=928724 RepID=I1D2H5_9PSEU|nr:ornithine cyclodeaminase [Saccharomonospora glauca]EIE99149.1 putative ornithine cyclodeaminase, mu-crystallin [Saccharomonospora glauca K62]